VAPELPGSAKEHDGRDPQANRADDPRLPERSIRREEMPEFAEETRAEGGWQERRCTHEEGEPERGRQQTAEKRTSRPELETACGHRRPDVRFAASVRGTDA
jgi:hypothetical protein